MLNIWRTAVSSEQKLAWRSLPISWVLRASPLLTRDLTELKLRWAGAGEWKEATMAGIRSAGLHWSFMSALSNLCTALHAAGHRLSSVAATNNLSTTTGPNSPPNRLSDNILQDVPHADMEQSSWLKAYYVASTEDIYRESTSWKCLLLKLWSGNTELHQFISSENGESRYTLIILRENIRILEKIKSDWS